ncbi:hypothetical protein V1478_002645, partial [Vespula squamosa]
ERNSKNNFKFVQRNERIYTNGVFRIIVEYIPQSFLKRFLNYKFVLPGNTGSSNLQVLFNRTTISDLQSRYRLWSRHRSKPEIRMTIALHTPRNKLYTFHILTLDEQKRKHVRSALKKRNEKKKRNDNTIASDVSNESQQVCSYGYTEFSTTPGLAICFCQDEK